MALLPELAREVSSAVPAPEYTSAEPICMAYRRIEGEPMSAGVDGIWPERLGRFLYDLHLTPPEFVGMRSVPAAAVREDLRREVDALGEHVLPLLDPRERATAQRTLSAYLDDDDNFRFATCLTHGDIGPEHVLVTASGDLAGVIDWGDAAVGDPASDFAWIVHAMPDEGERVLGAYGSPPDDRFLERARFSFMLMPWHEVKHGAETDQPGFVENGLAGVRERLA
jgi:aminoglycoside phosphotransferase (APT) family kinase protein